MSDFHFRRLLAALAAVAVAVSVSASETAPAMLRTAGDVSLNGIRGAKVSALLPRDVVQTTAESSAAISTRGTVIRILPNSTIIWGEVIEVQAGTIEVGTKSLMAVTSETYRFVPVRKDAKFSVTKNEKCSYMSVQEGAIKVEGGSKSTMVSAGSTFFFGERRCEAPSPGANGGTSASTARKAAALGGIGAAGIVTGLAASGSSCSPSSPDSER